MQTATAPQMRKSLELASSLKQAMIRFVPIPVIDDVDHARLLLILTQRLEKWRGEKDCMNCDKCDTQTGCNHPCTGCIWLGDSEKGQGCFLLNKAVTERCVRYAKE